MYVICIELNSISNKIRTGVLIQCCKSSCSCTLHMSSFFNESKCEKTNYSVTNVRRRLRRGYESGFSSKEFFLMYQPIRPYLHQRGAIIRAVYHVREWHFISTWCKHPIAIHMYSVHPVWFKYFQTSFFHLTIYQSQQKVARISYGQHKCVKVVFWNKSSGTFDNFLYCHGKYFRDTVFAHIVSAETILFWIWRSKGHST